MDTKRIAELANDLMENYDADVIAYEVGKELLTMIKWHNEFNVFHLSTTRANGETVFAAPHNLHDEVQVVFPPEYFENAKQPTPNEINVFLDFAVSPLVTLANGTRVQLLRDVERFPHFIARKGMTGTIVDACEDHIAVKMDTYIDGCEEWSNEIVWSDADVSSFRQDVGGLE